MQYRSVNTMDDLARDYAAFLDLIEAKKYRKLLESIGRGLNNKGYVTPLDDILFQIELKLYNIDLSYTQGGGKFTSIPRQLHEAVDFILGVGQTIPCLSASAKNKLRGKLVGGLKTKGLRPLQHEFRIATKLSNLEYEVNFADLESIANFDLLAVKGKCEFEIEAKSASIFSGRSILPDKAERVFDELRRRFRGPTETTQIPILDVDLAAGLPIKKEEIIAILEACNSSAKVQADQTVSADIQVKFVGTIPDAPYEALAAVALIDWKKSGVLTYVARLPPKVIVRFRSRKPDNFSTNVVDIISKAGRDQLTGSNPAAVCVHIDFIDEVSFRTLGFTDTGISQLDAIAGRVFESDTRNHIVQIMFSGGSPLIEDGSKLRSGFSEKIYNNPNSKFQSATIFPGGATRHRVPPP